MWGGDGKEGGREALVRRGEGEGRRSREGEREESLHITSLRLVPSIMVLALKSLVLCGSDPGSIR